MRAISKFTIAGVVALIAITSAVASPRAIVADYFNDGRIDVAYSVQDLRGALAFARLHQSQGTTYSAFADAVNQAITDILVGAGEAAQRQLTIPRTRVDVPPRPAPAPDPTPIPSGLPAPPQGSPADSIPWIVPVMAIIAAVLVCAGIASSIWRRVRRP